MHYVHLVLYNQSTPHERIMYECTRTLYDSFKPFVFTVYYTFAPVKELVFDARTCILQIPGTESFVPGILEKTWIALQWALNLPMRADYIVRSNISTVINFQNLDEALREKPVEYAGCHVLTLNWLHQPSGIVDAVHLGTRFASGTCIIWSASCLVRLIVHGNEVLDRSIVDDVALAIAMKRLGVEPSHFNTRFYFYAVGPNLPAWGWDPLCVHPVDTVSDADVEAELALKGNSAIAFRHRVHEDDRLNDIPLLARTVRYILKWNNWFYC